MGFWQTGYFEFHEPIGLDDNINAQPRIYTCKKCGKEFNNFEEMRFHRFNNHPYKKPLLYINGKEIGSAPITLTSFLKDVDIKIEYTEQIYVNGQLIQHYDLIRYLSKFNNDKIELLLKNRDNIYSNYYIYFKIPSIEDIQGVEKCFLQFAQGRCLDSRAIENFIAASNIYKSALNYCDGICEYFYGVLAKEHSKEICLSHDKYLEKFNRAINNLSVFQRPLSSLICSLISFHFNHFIESFDYNPTSRISEAAIRYYSWIYGEFNYKIEKNYNLINLEKILTDNYNEKIIVLSLLKFDKINEEIQYIEALTKKDLEEYDKTKLHIFLAEYYLHVNSLKKSKEHAHEIINYPSLENWSEKIIDRIKRMEQKNV